MQLQDLAVFRRRSPPSAASRRPRKKLHRTQPAVSQAIRRLEEELGDRLFDRSSRDGTLTEAGRLLQDYAGRLLTLAVGRRARRPRAAARCGAAASSSAPTRRPCTRCCRSSRASAARIRRSLIDVRRVPSRQIAGGAPRPHARLRRADVLTRRSAALQTVSLGHDELVMLANPDHPLAARKRVVDRRKSARETVIAHNDPSPARDRVLRLYERRHAPINIQSRAAEPRRHQARGGDGARRRGAAAPRARSRRSRAGRLVAVKVPELSAQRHVRLVFRRAAELSHAADAFLDVAVQASLRGRPRLAAGEEPAGRICARPAPAVQRTAAGVDRLVDLFVAVEQQPGRVPAAVEERLARRRRQRRPASASRRTASRSRRRDRSRRRAPASCVDRDPARRAIVGRGAADARHAERDRVAEEDLRERLADDRAESRAGGSPAARARATSRSRSCALTSRIAAPA